MLEVLNEIIGRKGKSTRVKQLSDEESGCLITDETVIAEKFIDYFENIGNISCENFVISDWFVNDLFCNVTDQFEFSYIDIEEL